MGGTHDRPLGDYEEAHPIEPMGSPTTHPMPPLSRLPVRVDLTESYISLDKREPGGSQYRWGC